MNSRNGAAHRLRLLQILTAAALVLALGSAFAASLAEVRSAFTELRHGKRSAEAAAAVIEDYLRANRESPLAMAYMGSVRTLQSDQEARPWKKMAYIDAGFELLDQAVAAVSVSSTQPDAVVAEVLLISGVTNASVPRLFHRRAMALVSLQGLLTHESFQQVDDPNRALAYAWLAVLTSEARSVPSSQSEAYLAEARRLDPLLAQEIWSKRQH